MEVKTEKQEQQSFGEKEAVAATTVETQKGAQDKTLAEKVWRSRIADAELFARLYLGQDWSEAELLRRLAMLDKLLNHKHDDSGECMECSKIVCPLGEPLHFHHDGCPACDNPRFAPSVEL